MRRSIVRLGIVVASVLACVFGFAVPAHAWGTKQNGCVTVQHTNRWGFFSGHNVDANVAICATSRGIYWAKQPDVTYPSRSPFGAMESVSTVTSPYFSGADYINGVAQVVRFRWSTRQCVLGVTWGPVCSTFDFRVELSQYGSRMCVVGGSCDVWKRW